MIGLSLDEFVENPSVFEGQKPFMGIGVGTDGVPIDLLLVHLLGRALDRFTLLIADEFSSSRIAGSAGLNDADLGYAMKKYDYSLNMFQKVWPTSGRRIISSSFMNSEDYALTLTGVEEMLAAKGISPQLPKLQTEWGKDEPDRIRYALNELAVIEFLRQTEGITVKVGPSSERKYDELMKLLSPEMKFLYLHPTFALHQLGEETSPHSIENITSIPNKRILLSDDPDTVEEKLNMGGLNALRYFAVLGSLAGRAMGHNCHSASEILEMPQGRVAELAQAYLLDNVVAAVRREQGISVYRKTPIRRIYDQTFMQAKVRFMDTTPDLVGVVRPELDSITEQLCYFINERRKFSFNPELYTVSFPHLAEAGILPDIPLCLYAPFLGIICAGEQASASPSVGLDLELMGLLQRRLLMGYSVAIAKLRTGKSVYDGVREEAVLQKASEKGEVLGLAPQVTRPAFQFVMDRIKDLQEIVISRYELDFSAAR